MDCSRLQEYRITSNRESPDRGGFNLRLVLTTRQKLKVVSPISRCAFFNYSD
jgi:hypothetical protein